MAKINESLLRDIHWEVFCHPPYSPDLAPSDFYAFLGLKKEMGGQRFVDDDGLKKAVTHFFPKNVG